MDQIFESFTPEQESILEQYVTNTKGSIFALHNLPEVIKGALFSRYSRSTLGLRSLLLREFIFNEEETALGEITGASQSLSVHEQFLAIKKAQHFYDRILDGYGDDSIGELGGTHLAIENVSMLAAKVLEDSRIGGSPLEKSTRYTFFDQKVHGEYLFHKEAVLMTSACRSLYLDTCNMLFDTYSRLIPQLTTFMMNTYPKDGEVSKNAYAIAIRAKVLDCVRGLLPASTLTNVGLFGNGRYYEALLHKLHCDSLEESQSIGRRAYEELSKIIPSFVRRAACNHPTHQSYAQQYEHSRQDLQALAAALCHHESSPIPYVKLIASDTQSYAKVAAALLYQFSTDSFASLLDRCSRFTAEQFAQIFDAACQHRQMRRHKSPRALENASYTFELMADFGAYRDLQRHRVMTQERQLLSCHHGYYTPPELRASGLDAEYHTAMADAKKAYDHIAQNFVEEAQYVVPMAYNIRWYATVNLRSLQWITELRSQAAGHASYRYAAQAMAQAVIGQHPLFDRFFKFVDYQDYMVGRLDQEMRSEQKKKGSS